MKYPLKLSRDQRAIFDADGNTIVISVRPWQSLTDIINGLNGLFVDIPLPLSKVTVAGDDWAQIYDAKHKRLLQVRVEDADEVIRRLTRAATLKAIEYDARNGTKFLCDRGFESGVQVVMPELLKTRPELLIADCIEFAGCHGVNVHPTLTHFQGYDCLKITITNQNDPT